MGHSHSAGRRGTAGRQGDPWTSRPGSTPGGCCRTPRCCPHAPVFQGAHRSALCAAWCGCPGSDAWLFARHTSIVACAHVAAIWTRMPRAAGAVLRHVWACMRPPHSHLVQRCGEHNLVVQHVLLQLGGGLDGGAAPQPRAPARRQPPLQRPQVRHLHQRVQRGAPALGLMPERPERN